MRELLSICTEGLVWCQPYSSTFGKFKSCLGEASISVYGCG